MRKFIHEIHKDDLSYTTRFDGIKCSECGARHHEHAIADSLGQVLCQDIGKRIYFVDGIYQVENDEQRDKRVSLRDSYDD